MSVSVEITEAVSHADKRLGAAILVRAYRRRDYIPQELAHLSDSAIVEKIVQEWIDDSATTLLGRRVKKFKEEGKMSWEMTSSLTLDRSTLPCDEVFKEEVDQLRQAGHRLAQITCLGASDERALCRYILMLLGAGVRTSEQSNIDMITAVVHPDHLRFYRDDMNFDLMAGGEVRRVPSANDQPGVGIYRSVQQLLEHKRTKWALRQAKLI